MEIRNGDWIQTFTGNRFYPFDLQPGDVHLEDIAHALSMICRCNGHARFFYSVGLHSINVAKEMRYKGQDVKIQLYGLLHDASEVYLSDIVTPVKKQLPEYKQLETKVQNTIWEAFDLPFPTRDEYTMIKHYDELMFKYEWKVLMDAKRVRLPNKDIKIKEMKFSKIKNEFMELASQLLKEV